MNHFELSQSTRCRVGIFVFITGGALGIICFLGGICEGMAPARNNTFNVLSAGEPWSRYKPLRDILPLAIRNGPPAYVSTTFLRVQPSQSNPSSCCCPPSMVPRKCIQATLGVSGFAPWVAEKADPNSGWRGYSSIGGGVVAGGDWGVGAFLGPGEVVWAKAKDRCTTVEVWGLTSDMHTAPSTNEQSKGVYLRITPPSSGRAGNCTEWKYREGEAPPIKPRRIIRPKRQAVRQLTRHDRPNPQPWPGSRLSAFDDHGRSCKTRCTE